MPFLLSSKPVLGSSNINEAVLRANDMHVLLIMPNFVIATSYDEDSYRVSASIPPYLMKSFCNNNQIVTQLFSKCIKNTMKCANNCIYYIFLNFICSNFPNHMTSKISDNQHWIARYLARL